MEKGVPAHPRVPLDLLSLACKPQMGIWNFLAGRTTAKSNDTSGRSSMPPLDRGAALVRGTHGAYASGIRKRGDWSLDKRIWRYGRIAHAICERTSRNRGAVEYSPRTSRRVASECHAFSAVGPHAWQRGAAQRRAVG